MPEIRTLQELLTKQLGVAVSPVVNPLVSQVGLAVTRVLGNNPNRVAAVVTNLSLNRIYISPDRSPSSSHGIRLDPNGGSIVLLWNEDFSLVGWEWNAIADAAGSSIFVLELNLR